MKHLIAILFAFICISPCSADPTLRQTLQESNKTRFEPLSMQVKFLKDCPEVIETLAEWEYDAWHGYDATLTRERLIRGFQKRLQENRLPLTLVAFKDSAPIGIISLEDKTETELADLYDGNPWGASFHIIPEMRRQGVGEALAKTLVALAKQMGYDKIRFYTSNESFVPWYTSRGAAILEQRLWRGHIITIMEYLIL